MLGEPQVGKRVGYGCVSVQNRDIKADTAGYGTIQKIKKDGRIIVEKEDGGTLEFNSDGAEFNAGRSMFLYNAKALQEKLVWQRKRDKLLDNGSNIMCIVDKLLHKCKNGVALTQAEKDELLELVNGLEV